VAKKVIREYERHERTCLPCCGLLLRLMQKPLDVRCPAAQSRSSAFRRHGSFCTLQTSCGKGEQDRRVRWCEKTSTSVSASAFPA